MKCSEVSKFGPVFRSCSEISEHYFVSFLQHGHCMNNQYFEVPMPTGEDGWQLSDSTPSTGLWGSDPLLLLELLEEADELGVDITQLI